MENDHGQFIHYETYGRVVSKAEKKNGSSLYTILGEAFREPQYSTHVDKKDTEASPPEIVLGMDFEKGMTDVQKRIAQKKQLIDLAEAYAKANKLRMKDGCILAGVVSYPPGTTREMLYFIRMFYVLPYLMKKWGKNLRCVIGHSDEYYWDDEGKTKEIHYQDHFYVIPDAQSEVRLTDLHAGITAKRKAIAGIIEKPNKETQREIWNANMPIKDNGLIENALKNYDLTKMGIKHICKQMEGSYDFDELCKEESKRKYSDQAYRDAMRREQDEFFAEVGEKVGWKRITVRGIRYSREQVKDWKKNQREMEKQQEAAKADGERIIKDAIAEAENITAEARNKGIEEAKEQVESILKRAKEDASIEAKKIIDKAKEDAKRLQEERRDVLQTARNEADAIIVKAESEAKALKDNAWQVAKDITDAAEEGASTMVEKAKGFVFLFLDKVSALPGGEVVARWARTFINTSAKRKEQSDKRKGDRGQEKRIGNK